MRHQSDLERVSILVTLCISKYSLQAD